jgi:hypothetical protein
VPDMDALASATAIGPQLGTVGAAFYFSPEASARASGIGIDVVSLYAAGRGGVLGDATPADVDDVFFFFKSGLIGSIVEAARASADPSAILEAHVGSAEDYAIATFNDVDPLVLVGFDDAATRVVEVLPAGRWSLVDGYRAVPVPSDPMASTYLRAVILRELRGGVHREEVESAGLTDAEACQFDQGDGYYRLHGYGDEDRVPETPEILTARASAEGATDRRMAELLSVLDEAQLTGLVAGAQAMIDTGVTVVLPEA